MEHSASVGVTPGFWPPVQFTGPHAPPEMHSTVQLVAEPHSIPPGQAPPDPQVTWQGTPAGHVGLEHPAAPFGQEMTQTPPSHAPPASGHASAHLTAGELASGPVDVAASSPLGLVARLA